MIKGGTSTGSVQQIRDYKQHSYSHTVILVYTKTSQEIETSRSRAMEIGWRGRKHRSMIAS